MKTPFPVRHPGRRVAAGLALCALMAACGSGGLAELLVKLITARFERSEVTLARGTTQRVALRVTCDLEGLNTPFGRLDVQVRFDPSRLLPPGLQVVPVGQDPDSEGWRTYPCEDPHPDPSLRAATIDIEVSAGAESTLTDETLLAVVRIEPLRPVDAPKDTTTAELVVRVRTPPVPGENLIANPGFEEQTATGILPTAPGFWQGDDHRTLTGESDVVPREGASMLKFIATGAIGSTNTLASQLWQTVDLRDQTALIAAGGVRADASAWFNRVQLDAATDRRFDLRLLAFDGNPADVGARYVAGTWLAQQTATVDAEPFRWQQVQASLVLPPNTTYVLVEIYAFEDVQNDAAGVEFDGHYADDISLVLVQP
jgi:hypothetical protein